MAELEKNYNPDEHEKEIYARWEASGFFNPDNLTDERAERFSMVLPPPNVTGTLHMGHALTVTIEDIIIRFQRMLGKKTLWVPGTDHASIATETKFLKEKKILRSDYADKRDEFINLVNDFAMQNQSVIIKQLRSMGASLDWSRLKYTLDKTRIEAVQEAFIKMHGPENGKGLIYMGKGLYPINWDVKGQTAVGDEEIEYEPGKAALYTFRYSKDFPIAISTTRPETKVGDTAVAVHPSDERYKKYIGKTYDVEFIGEKLSVKIIGDPSVYPAFGTGALGVTPSHSKIDAEIAVRHNLPSRQVINEYGRMIVKNERLSDKKTTEAREIIVAFLKENSLLEKEETIDQNIPRAQRSGGIIEPLPKRHQFFVNVNKPIPERDNKTLKELMRETITSGKIKIIPEHFEKVYLDWIDNLRDWNISRQIWYGHRLPVWYKPPAPSGDDLDYIVSKERPSGDGWEQFTDTLDTWFSSGLWTFSTLGWPDETQDLKTYHPTDVLETGYDILFFWVARMILMSSFFLGEVPFKTVYLHGLVRDEQRRKMSKSLGNVIDPMVMTEKYGTDALRMALIFNTAPGTDLVIAEDKIKGMKHFANKLWNISRFILMNADNISLPQEQPALITKADKAVPGQLPDVIGSVTRNLKNLQLHEAAQDIYQFVWHNFADVYIEASKIQLADETQKENTQKILLYSLAQILKLLHPFMPYITEVIWDKIPREENNLLMIEKWPN